MKYRKKPVIIEAMQLKNSIGSIKEVLRFMGQKVELKTYRDHDEFENYCSYVFRDGMKIKTLEGTMIASINDYVIKGINGEFYPCKPDIFLKTYEAVE